MDPQLLIEDQPCCHVDDEEDYDTGSQKG